MSEVKHVSRTGACLRALLASSAFVLAPAAAAQEQQPQTQPQGNSTIGAPQLRDFQLEPRQRVVTQPRPAPVPPPAPQSTPTPPPSTARPSTALRPQAEPQRPVQPAPQATGRPTPDAPAQAPQGPATTPETPLDSAPLTQLPAETSQSPAQAPAPTAALAPAPADRPGEGVPWWLLLVGGLIVGAGAYFLIGRRRRASERRALALESAASIPAEAVQPSPPRVPRPDPVPRPWLEIELKPERTTADPNESVVEFELTVRNNGGSTARNIKLQAKLICSTPEQDKEIAAFHRKKPGEHRTLDIPDLPAGRELTLKGQVDVKRDDIRALRVEQRLLFVPLIAVNAFYGWGTARSGQTSKSFLVGREKSDESDRMAPFRLDLGPRVYRTVGQRPYKVERRV